jgi:hypothetical protein
MAITSLKTGRIYNTSLRAGNTFIPVYANSVITSGLVMHLDAGNTSSYSGSGSTWTDISGFGNNITLVGSPTYSSTNLGNLVFNGSSQYGTISNVGSPFRQSNAITYDVWINVNAGGNLLGVSSSGGQGSGGISTGASNVYHLWTPSNPGSDTNYYNSTAVTFTNTWRHVCIVQNYASNTRAFYIDGNAVSTTTSGSVTTATPSTGYNLSQADNIGGRYVNSQSYFSGSIAAIKIYNTALSASDVLTNYNALKQRFA